MYARSSITYLEHMVTAVLFNVTSIFSNAPQRIGLHCACHTFERDSNLPKKNKGICE